MVSALWVLWIEIIQFKTFSVVSLKLKIAKRWELRLRLYKILWASYVEKHVSGCWFCFVLFFLFFFFDGAYTCTFANLYRGTDHSKATYKSALFLYLIFFTDNVSLWLHGIIRSVFNYCIQPLIIIPSFILSLGEDVQKRGGVNGGRVNAQLVLYHKCQVTEKVYIFTEDNF